MRTPYVRSEDGNDFTGSRPRAWLTPAQRQHSEMFVGSETQKQTADAIREAERIGSDGMVRALPASSLSYQESLSLLGMSTDDS
jgi:hypothetical protein